MRTFSHLGGPVKWGPGQPGGSCDHRPPTNSNSNSELPPDKSGSFELTDLGSCAYLDDPRAVSPKVVPLRSLAENLSAGETSGGFSAATESSQCPPDRDAECEVLHVTPPRKPGAAVDAFARARARCGSETANQTQISARVRPSTPSTLPLDAAAGAGSVSRQAPAATPPQAAARPPIQTPPLAQAPPSDDPLDDALMTSSAKVECAATRKTCGWCTETSSTPKKRRRNKPVFGITSRVP